MMMTISSGLHKDATGINVHVPYAFSYANAANRAVATGTSASDVGKFARQEDNNTIWMLVDDSPVTWVSISSTGSVSGGSIGNLSDFIYIRKDSDEIVNNSTSFQNDNAFVFAAAANGVYEIEYVLAFNGSSAADIKFAITYPSGGAIDVFSFGAGSDATNDAVDVTFRSQVISPASGAICGLFGCNKGQAGNGPMSGMLKALFRNSSTPGNVTLQWAQSSANASDTTLYATSYMIARKVG